MEEITNHNGKRAMEDVIEMIDNSALTWAYTSSYQHSNNTNHIMIKFNFDGLEP